MADIIELDEFRKRKQTEADKNESDLTEESGLIEKIQKDLGPITVKRSCLKSVLKKEPVNDADFAKWMTGVQAGKDKK